MAGSGSRGKLYVQIAQSIRAMVQEGRWLPGEKLPSLAELAKTFSCSRATVREALGALRGQGLVEFRHGDGTYVRTANVEMWMEPLEAAILLGRGQVRELVEVLTAVLSGIASFAADHVAEVDLGPVRTALFQMECATPYEEDSVVAEVGFYLILAECYGNRVLDNALRVLQEALRSSLRFARDRELMGLGTCRAVFDAIAVGDAAGARNVVYDYGRELQHRLTSAAGHAAQVDFDPNGKGA